MFPLTPFLLFQGPMEYSGNLLLFMSKKIDPIVYYFQLHLVKNNNSINRIKEQYLMGIKKSYMKNKQFSNYGRVIEGVGFSQTINLLFFLGILLESFCGSVEIETNVIKMSIIETFQDLIDQRYYIMLMLITLTFMSYANDSQLLLLIIINISFLLSLPEPVSDIEYSQRLNFALILEHLINSKNPPIGLAEDIKRFFEKGQEIYYIEGITTSYKYIIHIMEHKPELYDVICDKINSSTCKLNFAIIKQAYEKAYGIKDYNIPL